MRSAEAQTPLESLLRPRSVVVVGASENPDKVGGRPLKYLLEQGYRGRLHAVHPRLGSVQGVRAHAMLDEIAEAPDVAVLCVGAEQAEAQIAACGRVGVSHVLLFASGFGELGADGLQRERRVAAQCRQLGIRLLGPNSIGVASFDSGAVLSFASIYADHVPQDGPVAIVSQSGAFGVSAYALLREAGIGVRCVAATGNEADLDSADFISALAADRGVRLLLLYIESVKDVPRMRAALEAARERGLPVLAVRAARSPAGKRSARWHTGSDGAADAELDALFDAAGCRTVATLDEMVTSAALYLDTMPAFRLPRVAVVSNSGAACVLGADEAHRRGLPLAELAPATCARLDAELPSFSMNRNPIDLTAMLLADPSLLGRVLETVLADPDVDAVALSLLAIGGASYDVPRFARDARRAAIQGARTLVFHSPHAHVRASFAHEGIAVFRNEVEALGALQAFAAHGAAAHRV